MYNCYLHQNVYIGIACYEGGKSRFVIFQSNFQSVSPGNRFYYPDNSRDAVSNVSPYHSSLTASIGLFPVKRRQNKEQVL